MLALSHFAVGIAGGMVLLMLFPHFLPKLLTNDVFFLLASAFWAMIPDLSKFIKGFPHGGAWQNIFFFHTYLDKYADTITNVFITLVILAIVALIYFKALH